MATVTPKTINIQVDTTTGKITYGDQEKCHAKPGHEIVWKSTGPFAIQFLTTTPFTDDHFQSDPPLNGTHGKKRKVKDGVPSGEHEYAVAAYSGGKVFLDANCPAIIID